RFCRHLRYNEFPGRRPPRLLGFANTANCAYLREPFLQLDGFDELLSQVGYEDVDLSRRLMLLGYGLAYCRHAVVEHHHRHTARDLYRAFRKRGLAQIL